VTTIRKQSGVSDLLTPENTLSKNDLVDLMRQTYRMNMDTQPDYDSLKHEIAKYEADLPEKITMQDISVINKIYSMVQACLSRVTAIEMLALDNCGRWERLKNLMDGYIEDLECELLLDDKVQNLSNSRMQQAFVKNALKKEISTQRQVENLYNESEAFVRLIGAKKKNLASVLTNLSRQVKVLTVEYGLTR
jgi:hypothetical protein